MASTKAVQHVVFEAALPAVGLELSKPGTQGEFSSGSAAYTTRVERERAQGVVSARHVAMKYRGMPWAYLGRAANLHYFLGHDGKTYAVKAL